MSVPLKELAKQFKKISGNEDIAEGISEWAKVAKSRGINNFSDFPALEVEASKIQRFSKEAKKALGAKGFRVYELKGQSLRTLREQGHNFRSSVWLINNAQVEELTSRRSEVAITPEKLILNKSNNKTLKDQTELVVRYGQELQIPGIEAILGNAVDYVELATAFFNNTGRKLFGENSHYIRTRTKVGHNIVGVYGGLEYDDEYSAAVSLWENRSDKELYVAPLIVPV